MIKRLKIWRDLYLAPGNPPIPVIAARLAAIALLRRMRPTVAFTRNGIHWEGLSSCGVIQSLYVRGHYQDTYINRLSTILMSQEGFSRPFIVNVGANIGDVAIPLAMTGKRIIAIEPNPDTFRILVANVNRNRLSDRVTCCQLAISASGGTSQLVLASNPHNCEMLGESGKVGFDGSDTRQGLVNVETMGLDSLLASLGIPPRDVALVWSDTQGFESHVVESGSNLWVEGVPLWVEVWPKGLECHGGVARFHSLCGTYFSGFMAAEDLQKPPAPIIELAALMSGLGPGEFTDALFLPSCGAFCGCPSVGPLA